MKILVEMKHGLGDCVTMIPAVRSIRETFPNAYIALIVNGPHNKEIFEHAKIKIDRYYYFSLKGRSKLYTLQVISELWKERFTHGILAIMTPAFKGKGLFALLGIKRRYGEQYNGISPLKLDSIKHFVDRNLDVVTKIGIKIKDKNPKLYVDTRDYVEINSFYSSKKVAINIGGGDKNFYKGKYVFTRSWKTGAMKELVEVLSSRQIDIYLLGGPLEAELLGDYKKLIELPNVHDFVNKTTIGQTMYILSEMNLSVGVDTGMQHVADALGTKTLSIFGPTNPKTHGAYSDKAEFLQGNAPCQYCYGNDTYYTCEDRYCIEDVTCEEVSKKVIEILEK